MDSWNPSTVPDNPIPYKPGGCGRVIFLEPSSEKLKSFPVCFAGKGPPSL